MSRAAREPTTVQYDVIVAGGGMVGSLFAALLAARSELRVCVLEAALPAPFPIDSSPPLDLRVAAVNIGSAALFDEVGAWDGVLARRVAPFRHMLVWDGAGRGRTGFRADDIGARELGWIVENRVLQLALLERLQASEQVTTLAPARLSNVEVDASRVCVELDGGERLSTRLLVGADGARSRVREQAGIAERRLAYPQHALVATVRTRLPQQAITWQRFVPTGPQAFLPLPGAHASLVWYHDPDEVARLKALDTETFRAALEHAFPRALGGVETVLERGSFPIFRAHAERYVGERIALIGDAAHSVHPLAGQGVNLGMADADVLARTVLEAVAARRDFGRERHLRPYERRQRPENAMMIEILDGFFRAFGPQPAPVRFLRGRALTIADRVAPLRRRVMQRALGVTRNRPRV